MVARSVLVFQTQRKHCPCGPQLFQSVSGPVLVKSLHAGLIFSKESGHYLAFAILTPPVHKQLTLYSFSKGSLRHRSSATELPCVISQPRCLQMSSSHTLLAAFPVLCKSTTYNILHNITRDWSHELIIDLFSFEINSLNMMPSWRRWVSLLARCELQFPSLAEHMSTLIKVLFSACFYSLRIYQLAS